MGAAPIPDGGFVVTYRGAPIEFTPLVSAPPVGRRIGYLYRCPTGAHRALNWIDTESGTRHRLTRDAEGRVTIRNSLLCAQGCGWHVMITDGVAVDC